MWVEEYTVRRVSPLSAFRTGLALSLAGLAAWILTVTILYYGLDHFEIWDKLNQVIGGAGGDGVVTISYGAVLSVATLLGAATAIVTTIMSPLVAVIYNGLVDLFGGIRVVLEKTL